MLSPDQVAQYRRDGFLVVPDVLEPSVLEEARRVVDDASPVGWDPGPLDAYDARILRGRPTIEPRVEPVHIRIPLPKPDRAASIFELQEQVREGAFAR